MHDERSRSPGNVAPSWPWLVGVFHEPGPGHADAFESLDDLFGWLWDRFGDDGLLAIDEGNCSVDEARAVGIVEEAIVIDAAAAPAERDWVAELPRAEITLIFDGEESAREAAALLMERSGLRVAMPRELQADLRPPPAAPLPVPGFGWVLPPGCVPPPESASEGPGRVVIEEGIGFGTGRHATTRLCLRALAARVQIGGRIDRVLDIGAGSGILGLAAARLGASNIDVVEIDERVHAAIRHNASLNGVGDRVSIFSDPAMLSGEPSCFGPYDMVFANIVPEVLLELADVIVPLLGREGCLVVSGLRGERLEDEAILPERRSAAAVAACYARRCGAEPRIMSEEGWLCLVLDRGE